MSSSLNPNAYNDDYPVYDPNDPAILNNPITSENVKEKVLESALGGVATPTADTIQEADLDTSLTQTFNQGISNATSNIVKGIERDAIIEAELNKEDIKRSNELEDQISHIHQSENRRV